MGVATAVAALGLPFAGTALASDDAVAAEPAVTVAPATGLPASGEVDVEVSGFTPGETVSVTQCGGDVETGDILCRVDDAPTVSLDEDGAASTPLTVTSTFEGLDLVTGETMTIDCGTFDGGCHVGVAQTEGLLFASAPISFD
ncbi:Neocarzinostatin family protein [Actinoalloteichus cyanogriseus DSM 43889]|uniref:Neocarzinostatin family protein n=1 Tax=Actinoalloteichus caeruleus DSM 43889 TaxID=1120930 RepID=A0ABT1JDM5_ACTCY|nr:Neocarzinostatin family protein [Actinoalloteichus caeruleus DSM 43889]